MLPSRPSCEVSLRSKLPLAMGALRTDKLPGVLWNQAALTLYVTKVLWNLQGLEDVKESESEEECLRSLRILYLIPNGLPGRLEVGGDEPV